MSADKGGTVLKEPFLAVINSFHNCLFLEPLSARFPAVVRGGTVSCPVPLCSGAKFSIGGIDFEITESTAEEPSGSTVDFSGARKKPMLQQQVLSGDSGDSAVNLELPPPGRSVTLGRGDDVTFTVDDPMISKKHLQMIVYDKNLLVSDLDSTNGTFENGESIRKRLMHAGDFLSAGDHTFFSAITKNVFRISGVILSSVQLPVYRKFSLKIS
jgi:pSer/pThr/pTyr-binding forkhead associated (FHA) protein